MLAVLRQKKLGNASSDISVDDEMSKIQPVCII